ncbi:PREDICTED: probable xyloglucan endotransglucosylase/hydrolase protein 6 [Camelina sativa]|uniref:Xyloglucan endotransglucosylase/hydrolase n=1 Tax=Camelina sativa TaxID=90675 RepID=A0ABM1R5V1_CAMSA|nr:PREDICTED: probable xyloglucan endotransglucosylase/hydrolase protein 6 [Camelina sativa]XP_010484417.1 PREDICTED: probable xyloglucan endotransglucosylase/hydrolase protein 6 [Camelina sativa]XP_019094389.1 PREDICTED: probable xyloglucan endotransglucosylase/hydrolase protein 6 [Camelina sativa]
MAKIYFPSFLDTYVLCILTLFAVMFIRSSARPTTFAEDFKAAWSESHIRQMDGGKAIQLVLDQSTGCGFASKRKYLFGRVSMKIKLIPGDSAGTVTAFYMNSDTNTVRDELDFEFLGNRSGQPYSVQTNIFAHGKGDREQRVNLWFDPALDFHTYTILWSHKHIVFYVDDVPIREYKNNEAKNIAYPTSQPMGVYSTLWEADDWATRGGLEKIDWKKAPFYAYYKDFDIEGCPVPGPTSCPSNPHNWWEGYAYQSLNAVEARRYRWVRVNHMVYDYCTDRSRFPVPPPECRA